MPLRPPPLTDPPFDGSSESVSAPFAWEVFRCKLVTPMMGGGVASREVDTGMPVRASGIRGQLRFWWRLLAKCKKEWGLRDPRDRREAERKLWGGIGSRGPVASRVWLRVRCTGNPVKVSPKNYQPGYALFPATNDKVDGKTVTHDLLKEGLTFELYVGFDASLDQAHRDQVHTALRWWASFGGIGARTRRGLGAVWVEGFEPVTAAEVEQCDGCRLMMGAPVDKPLRAWETAIAHLRAFRQGPGVGRNPGAPQGRPGRSRWPEADMIRRASGRHAPQHPPQHKVADCWPRAAFGMPIVVHFKDHGEPEDVSLQPIVDGEIRERMASPLILRPMQDGEGRWCPGALLLPHDHALSAQAKLLSIRGGREVRNSAHPVWPGNASQRQAAMQRIEPLAPYAGQAQDPLEAFLEFFARGVRKQGGGK